MKKAYITIFSFLFLITGCTESKCPIEYNYDNGACYKILETNALYKTEYYCITGTLIDNMCYMSNSNMIVPAHQFPYTYTYYCDYGYNMIGNMCYPISNIPATRTITSCPDGYTKNKTGVAGLEVPQIEVPGAIIKCYRRISILPK
ncbi:MAG: hypothetical protein Q4E75_02085 [bacterium]|nr:hypothetical protein [bacterium]